jgi:transcriptional regulator with XRE-family HTH domain
MDYKVISGQNMTLLRKEARISQEDMAEKIGITRSGYSSYEEFRAHPPVKILIRFCDAFGITVDKLVRSNIPQPQSAVRM